MLGEILGPDLLVVLIVVAVLFGGAKLPKLARSLGSAKSEFEKGLREADGAPSGPAPVDDQVTMTRAELDEMLARRESEARRRAGGPSPS